MMTLIQIPTSYSDYCYIQSPKYTVNTSETSVYLQEGSRGVIKVNLMIFMIFMQTQEGPVAKQLPSVQFLFCSKPCLGSLPTTAKKMQLVFFLHGADTSALFLRHAVHKCGLISQKYFIVCVLETL